MYTKLTTAAQVAELRKGDIIRRFPSDGKPANTFDETQKKQIDTYKIQSINANSGLIGLVMTGDSLVMFASPVDIERLLIQPVNLVSEQNWWYTS